MFTDATKNKLFFLFMQSFLPSQKIYTSNFRKSKVKTKIDFVFGLDTNKLQQWTIPLDIFLQSYYVWWHLMIFRGIVHLHYYTSDENYDTFNEFQTPFLVSTNIKLYFHALILSVLFVKLCAAHDLYCFSQNWMGGVGIHVYKT